MQPSVLTNEQQNERRFDRGSWVTLSTIVVFLILCLAGTAAQLTIPNDGCLMDTTSVATPTVQGCVGDWHTPLRVGDTIEQFAGRSAVGDPTQVVKTLPPAGWVDGGVVQYRVVRAGQTLDLAVPLHDWSVDQVARAFWFELKYYTNDLVLLLCTAVIFWLRPGSRAAQLLLVAFASIAIHDLVFWPVESTMSGNNFVSSPLAWFPGNLPGSFYGWLLVAPLLLLVLSFPRPIWPVSRWPRLVPILVFGLAFAATLASFAFGNFLIYLAQLGLYAALVLIAFIVATVYTVLRVRDPVVRAQTAWLGLGLAGFSVNILGWIAINSVPEFSTIIADHPIALSLPLDILRTFTLPVCLGIAITRYRLFDIEVIIRRTLVYSVLTITLGLVYVGCILLGQALLTLVIPQADQSQVATVASTLVIAALFFPLRRRIQDLIDRRFYRRKYNAQQGTGSIRPSPRATETDLQALTAELGRVVNETVQPEFVSVWLRKAPSEKQ